MMLQVALGLITAKASHIVWPPNRWQRIKYDVIPDRLLIIEPSNVVNSQQTLSAVDIEETLSNDSSGNSYNNPVHRR